MTAASEIIREGFREGNLIPVGKEPTAPEQTEALASLNRYLDWLFADKIGIELETWNVPPSRSAPVAARYPLGPSDKSRPADVWPYPPDNVQLITRIEEPTTIYLPFDPNDGSRVALADVGSSADLTVNANGKLIQGVPALTLTPATAGTRRWFYRADRGEWVRFQALTIDSESPLPSEFDDLLVTALAIRLSPRYSKQPSPVTVSANSSQVRSLRSRYWQTMPVRGKFGPSFVSEQAFGQYGVHEEDLL